jgi:hypothetical protein
VDPVGLWEICCDKCSPGGAKKLRRYDFRLKHAMAANSPGLDTYAGATYGTVQYWATVVNLLSIAGGGSIPASLWAALDGEAGDAATSWADALVGMTGAIAGNLAQLEGVRVWTYVEWDECLPQPCLWTTRLDWQRRSQWKNCSAYGTGRQIEGGFDLADPAGILAAISPCFKAHFLQIVTATP